MNQKLVNRWIASEPMSKKQIVALMSDAETLTHELIVYRGSSWSADFDKLSRRVFATSLSRRVAGEFLGYEIDDNFKSVGRHGELLVMHVKPGIKVLIIPGVQEEVLIQRGTAITITSRRVVNNVTITDVDATRSE
jgi:hypothetical protein